MLNKEFGFAEISEGRLRFCIKNKPKKNYFITNYEIASFKDKNCEYFPVPSLIPANADSSYLKGWFLLRQGDNWTLMIDEYSNLKVDVTYEFYIR